MNMVEGVGITVLCLGLSGCAGMHLYNEKRDLQGQALQTERSKFGPTKDKFIAAMREQDLATLEANLKSIDGAGAFPMEAAVPKVLNALVGTKTGNPNTFARLIEKELDNYGKTIWAPQYRVPVDRFRSRAIALADNRATQATYRRLIEAEGNAAPACPANKRTPGAAPDPHLADLLNTLADLCGRETTAMAEQEAAIAQLSPGGLQTAAAAVTRHEQAYATAVAHADAQMAAYRSALAQYSAAVQANGTSTAPSVAIAAAGTKVRQLLALLTAAEDVALNVAGQEAVADERLERIDGILAKLGTTDDPGADATRAQLAAVLVTRIADDAQVLAQSNTAPVRASLAIQRDLARSSADLAQAQAALERKGIMLDQANLASMVDATFWLQAAHRLVEAHAACYADVRFQDAVTSAPAARGCDARQSVADLYDAAGNYLFSIRGRAADSARLGVLRRDLRRQRNAALATDSIEQWSVLIDATAGQAVTYAATGQKTSDYTDLIQSVLLLGITNGVYK